jgi:hypothetical protein
MARVKTFVESLKGGYEKAFERLDRKVEGLGKVEIRNISDLVHPVGSSLEKNELAYLERIVIYRAENKLEGRPWKPTLDTDLLEFLGAVQPPCYTRNLIEETYEHGKKTIRDLIAMPYGWFKERCCGGVYWKSTQKTLRRYGFKLHKRGFVVRD